MEMRLKSLVKKHQKLIALMILVLLALPAIWPLFHSGFFLSDDGEWMIIRFSAFHQALADGQLPVRWLGRLNHEYGYPVANFLYPGFMYFGEPLHLLGFGFVDTIKIILGLSLVGSAVFSFLWLARFFGVWEAFIGGVIYLYAPYHLFDLYKRGSVGEILALAIIPFIFWQIERKSILWSVLSIGLLILSHNTLAIIFLPLILLYILLDILIVKERKKVISRYFLTLFLSLGLSAFFWIPAIFDLKHTVFFQTSVSNFSEYFAGQEMIGLETFLVFLLVFGLFLSGKIKISKHRLTGLLFVVGLTSLFLASFLSMPLWNILPASFVQFPFRLLSVTILSVSFLAACALSVLSKKAKGVVGLVLLISALFSAKPFIAPSQYFDKGDASYATNEDTTTVHGEYMPQWVKIKLTERPRQKVELVKGAGVVQSQFSSSREVIANVNLEGSSLLQVNVIYFPGWQVWVDGQKAVFNYDNEKGVMQIPLTRGEHQILVNFSETPLRLFSDIISLISLATLSVYCIKTRMSYK